MLKNNNERKQRIENEDNYEIITVSEFARYRKSRPLDDGSCIVVFETKMRGNTWDYEKNKIVEKIKWSKIGMFITYSYENETLLEQTCISDIVSRMAKMK